MTKTKSLISAELTAAAARVFNRRVVLKAGAAAGAIAVAGPAYVKSALSSSGEINLLMWSDEFPNPVIPDFEFGTTCRNILKRPKSVAPGPLQNPTSPTTTRNGECPFMTIAHCLSF